MMAAVLMDSAQVYNLLRVCQEYIYTMPGAGMPLTCTAHSQMIPGKLTLLGTDSRVQAGERDPHDGCLVKDGLPGEAIATGECCRGWEGGYAHSIGCRGRLMVDGPGEDSSGEGRRMAWWVWAADWHLPRLGPGEAQQRRDHQQRRRRGRPIDARHHRQLQLQ